MNRLILHIILILVFVSAANSQTTITEKYRRIPKSEITNDKINEALNIAESLIQVEPERARVYALQALNMSMEISNDKGIADALLKIGNCDAAYGNHSFAVVNYLKAIEYYSRVGSIQGKIDSYSKLGMSYKALNDLKNAIVALNHSFENAQYINDRKQIAQTLYKLSVLYFDIKDLMKSLEYISKSYDICLEIKSDIGAANALIMYGYIYYEKDLPSQAIPYFQKSIEYSKKINDFELMQLGYMNLAMCYKEISDYDNALLNQFISNDLLQKMERTEDLLLAYFNTGLVLSDLNRSKEAEEYLNKSLELAKSLNNSTGIAQAYLGLGEILIKSKNYSKAEKLLHEAEAIFLEEKDMVYIGETYHQLLKLYILLNKSDMALQYQKKLDEYQKEINIENSELLLTTSTAKVEAMRELEIAKKETAILEAKNSNYFTLLTIISVGFILLVSLTATYLIMRKKLKSKEFELSKALSSLNRSVEPERRVVTLYTVNTIDRLKDSV